jgi:hypothetical protein
MAAITLNNRAVNSVLTQLAKREKNWAQREVGVVVVFAIVFVGKFCSSERLSPLLDALPTFECRQHDQTTRIVDGAINKDIQSMWLTC